MAVISVDEYFGVLDNEREAACRSLSVDRRELGTGVRLTCEVRTEFHASKGT